MPIVPAVRSVRPVERLFRLGGYITPKPYADCACCGLCAPRGASVSPWGVYKHPSPTPIVPAVRSVRPVEHLFRLGER